MKATAKRYLALALSFALFLALPLAATQEASAASGSKVWVPAQVTRTSTGEDAFSNSTLYNYNKKGLPETISYTDGYKIVQSFNTKGVVKSEKYYDEKGVLYGETKNTIKSNKIRKSEYYEVENGKSTLSGTWTYAYKKGKVSKETYSNADGSYTTVTNFRTNGKRSKSYWKDSTSEGTTWYDKKGNPTKDVYSGTDIDEQGKSVQFTSTTTYKNTYKKGKLVKTVEFYTGSDGKTEEGATTVYTYKKGKKVKAVSTYMYTVTDENDQVIGRDVAYIDTTTYTYTKLGYISKVEYVSTDGKGKVEEANTTTYKYKKVKVAKKAKSEIKKWVTKGWYYKAYL